ncbi:MAG: 50S ribosomal protein L29 [Deltaproteobacteria bacterium]|nr:50S ribosomal protein L29 [Deltaproteobacteria bacterium]
MKIEEIRNLNMDDLAHKNESLAEELFKLRFRHTSGQLDSPAVMKNLKRDIARIKTVLREREGVSE